MLRARLLTAAVAIPLLLALIYFSPSWGWAAIVGTLSLLGLVEYAGLAFADRLSPRIVTMVLGALVIAAAISSPAPGPHLSAALSLLIIGGLVYVVLARRDLDRGLADIGVMTVGVLYAGLLLPHFFWLHGLPDGPHWVTFVIAVGMAGDTGGYFIGHAYGRHKLIPHVSPGKTLEGALGIVVFSLVAGVVTKLILLPGHSWGEMLSLAAVMGVIGQIGDLGESVMKRTFGAKESGWILPGHGGVLDRIDSLLFPVTLVYYYVAL